MSLSKEEYLKRYLSGSKSSKGQKKKKKGSNIKIIDDNADFKSTLPKTAFSKTLDEELDDDRPTVVDIDDPRYSSLLGIEQSKAKWKSIDPNENEEEKTASARVRHDSSDSDISIDRPVPNNHSTNQRVADDSDSDLSLPRPKDENDSDSDLSLDRNVSSPKRKKRKNSPSSIENKATVFRDKSGRRRDLKKEAASNKKSAEEKEKELAKYTVWNKGVKQTFDAALAQQEFEHEAAKPFTRTKDDEDMNEYLKQQERKEDTMLDYIKQNKKGKKLVYPKYDGPLPPPNRFNILPGYRYDGVDRSNGFESKLFEQKASKEAVKEHSYKWSVENM